MIFPYLFAIIISNQLKTEGKTVAICYNNLWKLLIDKKMNKTDLKEAAGISFNVIAKMGKNKLFLSKVSKKSAMPSTAILVILLRLSTIKILK